MREQGPDDRLEAAAAEETERPATGEPSTRALRVIVGVGLGAIVIFAVGIAGAAFLQLRVTGWLRPPRAVPEAFVTRPEVGPVDKLPFEFEPVLSRRDRQRERLESYGWVDRERGIAHVPIEVAMDEVVREEAR